MRDMKCQGLKHVFPKTTTFEAERQAFYDNEHHLKSRIQSLTQARTQAVVPRSPTVPDVPETETDEEVEEEVVESSTPSQEKEDPHAEPAELTAMKLELSTLSTSYASLQNTLVLLQTQLVDLKRVNNQLQEENESYNILLREKTLSGQYDVFRQVSGDRSSYDEEESQTDDMGDVQSMRSGAYSSQLGTVDKHPDRRLCLPISAQITPILCNIPTMRDLWKERVRTVASAIVTVVVAMAVLHIHPRLGASPLLDCRLLAQEGLDLAAELGRAENKDILEGHPVDVSVPPRDKRGKKGSSESRKLSAGDHGMDRTHSLNEVDTLRNEIKSLKDANKALSLYASKIMDRIIAQEGFEHVLAVDYEAKSPATPTATTVASTNILPPNLIRNRSDATRCMPARIRILLRASKNSLHSTHHLRVTLLHRAQVGAHYPSTGVRSPPS